MQKVIHKFPVRVPEEKHLPLELTLPEDHEIVHVDDPTGRGESLSFWALVDPESEHVTRELLVVATGDTVDEEHVHLATILTRDGRIVLHVLQHVDDLPLTDLAVEDDAAAPIEEEPEAKEETPEQEPEKGKGRGRRGKS